MKATVGERIVLHLYKLRSYREEFVAPRTATQDGIGLEVGISRAHAAVELRKMLNRGAAEKRLAHVKGLGTRRMVFFLTPKGEEEAKDLLGFLSAEGIRAEAVITAPVEKRVKASLSNSIVRLREEVLRLRSQLDTIEKQISALESQEALS